MLRVLSSGTTRIYKFWALDTLGRPHIIAHVGSVLTSNSRQSFWMFSPDLIVVDSLCEGQPQKELELFERKWQFVGNYWYVWYKRCCYGMPAWQQIRWVRGTKSCALSGDFLMNARVSSVTVRCGAGFTEGSYPRYLRL